MKTFLGRQRWWLGRVAVLPLHLLVFAVAAFFLVRAIPGDPAREVVGPEATEADYLATKAELGLDGSLWSQLMSYLSDLLHFDLGNAIMTGRPVTTDIADRLPGTLELAGIAFFFLLAITLLLSGVVVSRPRSIAARAVRGYAQAAGAVPEFVVGVVGIFLFYATLQVVPAPTGRVRAGLTEPEPLTSFPLLDAILRGDTVVVSSMISHLLLPIAVLVLSVTPILLKQLLTALDSSLTAQPTMFKIATGSARKYIYASAYRRALPPTVALFGMVFGSLLGGAVILETLFGLGGMGRYAVEAVAATDLIALQGFLLVVAAISLIVFLCVDLVNMLLDPRRKPGRAGGGS
ncbi:peptide ABC transporter [Rhodococcus sp. 05-2255-3B1]|uniref:ABC transporter permease n=1 Tax=unclassified Rhodococcus (in: high G+C Gram-positive bacteria) TaxID=192944 RepID=UPI000B9A760A|nr:MULTISPECIES: ABC transporter permease [unclassified Rhodococcus (in: high G+C Gram-positive bacteria)]OZE05108.1 peptide ABC transporter [Rhodococcus sp. 05-2255-3C]OZE11748.1 peptide ABC transporter [Rhodococcus sp. 05-2255-3B1]OZE24155.1 peptide ABC transporter [Rhodococcus sp. 05-2255-2A2]